MRTIPKWAPACASAPFLFYCLLSISALGGRVDASDRESEPTETREQRFTTDPATQGWSSFGDPELFHWNAATGAVDVTWDSSHPNSYLFYPLKTLLTRHDDFRAELDLILHDIAGGVDEDKPGPMQIAFGFQNRRDAQFSTFNRGTATDSPNLVEFNFFPDTGFGPTVWPAVYSTNSAMNYNGSGDFNLFDLPTQTPLHIVLAYTSSNQTVTLSIWTNGALVGPVTAVPLSTNATSLSKPFTAFEVDTFSISSYTDVLPFPSPYGGSVLAHGAVDNVVLVYPSPPIREEQFQSVSGQWEQSFLSRKGWTYTLQTTGDLRQWTDVGAAQQGNGQRLTLIDRSATPSSSRFYRVHANRVP